MLSGVTSKTKVHDIIKDIVTVDEIMRIAQAQVVVTAEMDTMEGCRVSVRQSTEAEEELAAIYGLLDITDNPIGKVRSVVPLKGPPKKPPPENQ